MHALQRATSDPDAGGEQCAPDGWQRHRVAAGVQRQAHTRPKKAGAALRWASIVRYSSVPSTPSAKYDRSWFASCARTCRLSGAGQIVATTVTKAAVYAAAATTAAVLLLVPHAEQRPAASPLDRTTRESSPCEAPSTTRSRGTSVQAARHARPPVGTQTVVVTQAKARLDRRSSPVHQEANGTSREPGPRRQTS